MDKVIHSLNTGTWSQDSHIAIIIDVSVTYVRYFRAYCRVEYCRIITTNKLKYIELCKICTRMSNVALSAKAMFLLHRKPENVMLQI